MRIIRRYRRQDLAVASLASTILTSASSAALGSRQRQCRVPSKHSIPLSIEPRTSRPRTEDQRKSLTDFKRDLVWELHSAAQGPMEAN